MRALAACCLALLLSAVAGCDPCLDECQLRGEFLDVCASWMEGTGEWLGCFDEVGGERWDCATADEAIAACELAVEDHRAGQSEDDVSGGKSACADQLPRLQELLDQRRCEEIGHGGYWFVEL